MEGFEFAWSLSMMEAVGVLGGSFLERMQEGTHMKMVAPFRSYVLLAGLLAMSSSLSNIALKYIKYPTKVYDAMEIMCHGSFMWAVEGNQGMIGCWGWYESRGTIASVAMDMDWNGGTSSPGLKGFGSLGW